MMALVAPAMRKREGRVAIPNTRQLAGEIVEFSRDEVDDVAFALELFGRLLARDAEALVAAVARLRSPCTVLICAISRRSRRILAVSSNLLVKFSKRVVKRRMRLCAWPMRCATSSNC